jgi:dethiobiotin synthetase
VGAVFVTGTGTGVGKTFVTAGLIGHLRKSGRSVEALKPIVSGFDPDRVSETDTGVLLAALGRPAAPTEIDRVSPWRFRAPVSPDLAAALEGRTVDYSAVIEYCRRPALAAFDIVLIEGVGGVMVPLDDRHTVLDLLTVLRIPTILVTGNYLGTISHTLTALHVLAQRKVDVSAVVISEGEGGTVALADNADSIARFAVPIEVVDIPRLPPGESGHPAFARLAGLL